ncbi:MAG: DUF2213 domain-containing protein [Burkholderia gladioli]
MKREHDECLAFDRATVRSKDSSGRLHVEISNISKAAVNPYFGRDIPKSKALGLDPDSLYFLLRDPVELEKAATTFNNIPLLSKHIPVTVDAPHKEIVVGSTGTDAIFQAPYLRNSLVVWDAVAIAGIESREQKELSSAYAFDADMTPGSYEGMKYDGVMRNIRGNHVALVEVGRAGPDVVVGDSKPSEIPSMKHSNKAIAVAGALHAYLFPKLAQDAQIGDIGELVRGVKAATWTKDKERVAKSVERHMKEKLAQDADLADLPALLDAFDNTGKTDDVLADDDNELDDEQPVAQDDVAEKLRGLLRGKLDDSVIDEICAALSPGAADEPPAFEDKPIVGGGKDGEKDKEDSVPKTAMDAAISKAKRDTESATIARMNAIRVAENEVRPLIGDVAAMDSAESVYKMALDSAEVDVTGVDPSAYRAMTRMLVKQSAAPKTPSIAMDSAARKSFTERYPHAANIKRS